MYGITLSGIARKQLAMMEKGDARRMVYALERIRIRPETYLSTIVGYPGYRLKVGESRIILDVYQNNLFVLILENALAT